MNVGFSEEQQQLRESARAFLSRECPISLVRAQMDHPTGLPEALWREIASLGWLGLLVDPEHGGSGLGLVDLALLLEEAGRSLLPGPFLSTAVVGAVALAQGGTPEQQQTYLPKLADGTLRTALAQLEADASWEFDAIQLPAQPVDAGYRLDGVKHFVNDAASANLLIVAVRVPTAGHADDLALMLVDPSLPGVSIRPVSFVEQTRKVCEVRFDQVVVPHGNRLGAGISIETVLTRVHDFARVGISAESCGGAQRVLEMSVDYAKTREQFGQPIGSFQALQHKCADMLIQCEGIRSATYYAAWAIDAAERDQHTTSCLAKAYTGDA
jgi:alkylation response protein AidB-like acyl-CoA dehydrogenase